MKSMLLGLAAAILFAILAWAVLDGTLQRSVEQGFQTEGVRL